MTTKLLKMPDVKARLALSKSEIYKRIGNKVFPPAIRIGPMSAVWTEQEIEAIQRAYIAGKSVPDLKKLTRDLVNQRQAAA